MIWCNNHLNVHIHTFRKRWTFILGCFFPVIILNIDILNPSKDTSNHPSDLLDVFNLKNFVMEPTCFMSDKDCCIDIILTNKPRSFQKTQGFVTGISDIHKLVVAVLRSYYKKLPAKNILYKMLKGLKKQLSFETWTVKWFRVGSIIIVKNPITN